MLGKNEDSPANEPITPIIRQHITLEQMLSIYEKLRGALFEAAIQAPNSQIKTKQMSFTLTIGGIQAHGATGKSRRNILTSYLNEYHQMDNSVLEKLDVHGLSQRYFALCLITMHILYVNRNNYSHDLRDQLSKKFNAAFPHKLEHSFYSADQVPQLSEKTAEQPPEFKQKRFKSPTQYVNKIKEKKEDLKQKWQQQKLKNEPNNINTFRQDFVAPIFHPSFEEKYFVFWNAIEKTISQVLNKKVSQQDIPSRVQALNTITTYFFNDKHLAKAPVVFLPPLGDVFDSFKDAILAFFNHYQHLNIHFNTSKSVIDSIEDSSDKPISGHKVLERCILKMEEILATALNRSDREDQQHAKTALYRLLSLVNACYQFVFIEDFWNDHLLYTIKSRVEMQYLATTLMNYLNFYAASLIQDHPTSSNTLLLTIEDCDQLLQKIAQYYKQDFKINDNWVDPSFGRKLAGQLVTKSKNWEDRFYRLLDEQSNQSMDQSFILGDEGNLNNQFLEENAPEEKPLQCKKQPGKQKDVSDSTDSPSESDSEPESDSESESESGSDSESDSENHSAHGEVHVASQNDKSQVMKNFYHSLHQWISTGLEDYQPQPQQSGPQIFGKFKNKAVNQAKKQGSQRKAILEDYLRLLNEQVTAENSSLPYEVAVMRMAMILKAITYTSSSKLQKCIFNVIFRNCMQDGPAPEDHASSQNVKPYPVEISHLLTWIENKIHALSTSLEHLQNYQNNGFLYASQVLNNILDGKKTEAGQWKAHGDTPAKLMDALFKKEDFAIIYANQFKSPKLYSTAPSSTS